MKTLKEIADEVDSGQISQETIRDLFLVCVTAKDFVDHLFVNIGNTADWPLALTADTEEDAALVADKYNALKRSLPE